MTATPLTSDQAALTRAVLEDPADDAPRLVFADWFEDDARPRQPARAEFIRLQAASARRHGRPSPDELALFLGHWRAWVPAALASDRTMAVVHGGEVPALVLPGSFGLPPLTFHFDRGFLGFAMGPYLRLMGKLGWVVFDANPITAAVPADRFPDLRRPPPRLRAIVRELAYWDRVSFADDPADVLGSAVVLWHRRRLGLADIPAGRAA